jgi:hypothetical protein
MALLCSALFLMPRTPSSLQRWIDAIGAHLPTPEELLQHLLALTPATACHLDGYYPRGTDHGVMVVQDELTRSLSPHEAAAEHGENAKTLRQPVNARGLNVTAAFSDDSPSCTEALKAIAG